ncbi:hypothetical protein IEQ34_021283 [Dendrobium chrysotoxum]|uniref:Uncharacterized protein n=1 Tax=Dendrobium chrysotoxum TaxID=161865 RepID=A0AAV7G366_DENCH|nr:hypothetical protein IEQ34_021283 [Dendrobium chrysotoxum]
MQKRESLFLLVPRSTCQPRRLQRFSLSKFAADRKTAYTRFHKRGGMGPRCGADNEADNHLKILSSAFVSSRQTVYTRFLKRGGKGTRHIKLVSERGFWRDGSKKIDVLKGKMEQSKSDMEEKFLTMENRMESPFGGIEEVLRKLMNMQSKTPPVVPITDPNQDLIGIPLAKSKGKEIGRKGFNEESFFHQEPPPRAPIKGGSGFPEEET